MTTTMQEKPSEIPTDPWITTAEVMDLLGITANKVSILGKNGMIRRKPTRLDRRTFLYSREDVLAILRERESD